MAIRKIARLGNPVLRQPGKDLTVEEIGSAAFKQLIQDMVDTMKEYGGIGIAAPQIHESLQAAIIEFDSDSSRYPGMGDQPLTILVNPKLTVLDPTEQGYWEGCLSVPELRGFVNRPRKVRVDYLDENAKPRSIVAEDFLATVFQHELDHLSGVLFIDRLATEPGKTQLAFVEEYKRFIFPTLKPENEIE